MPEIVVATFNAHWGLDRRSRGYDVTEVCRRLDADILVLQETWRADGSPGHAAQIGDRLGYQVRQVTLGRGDIDARPRMPAPGRGDWGLAILTRVPVVAEERIDLGQLPLDPARRWALRLDLELEPGATPVPVVGTHLSHLSHGSLVQLRRLASRLPGVGRQAVLTGDMNMWGPLVSAFLPGWRRAVRARTWPAQMPHSQIDHILVTKGVGVVAGQRLPPLGSDHRALRAVLRVG